MIIVDGFRVLASRVSRQRRSRRFLEEFASARATDPLPRLVELVHAWRRFPLLDPALPRQLLPQRWSGERAAALCSKRHATWSAVATWAELEHSAI